MGRVAVSVEADDTVGMSWVRLALYSMDVAAEVNCFCEAVPAGVYYRFFLFISVLLVAVKEVYEVAAACGCCSSLRMSVVGGRSGCTLRWWVSTMSE